MTIYIVTDTVYNDYGILGVFSSEDKAINYINLVNKKNIEYHPYKLDSGWDSVQLTWKGL